MSCHLNCLRTNHSISHLIQSRPQIQKASSPLSLLFSASPPSNSTEMATVAAPALSGSLVNLGGRTPQTKPKLIFVKGLNSYSGLKAHNVLSTLGKPVSSRMAFAKVVSNMNMRRFRGGGGGGGFAVTCNKVGEIFQIAAIINGLTLVGVAVGFVLLRIEAAVEESE